MGSSSEPIYTVFTVHDPKTNKIVFCGVTSQSIRARLLAFVQGAKFRQRHSHGLSLIDEFILKHPDFSTKIVSEGLNGDMSYELKAQICKLNRKTLLYRKKSYGGRKPAVDSNLTVLVNIRFQKRTAANLDPFQKLQANPNQKRGPNGKYCKSK